jgi:hypothetical protein
MINYDYQELYLILKKKVSSIFFHKVAQLSHY